MGEFPFPLTSVAAIVAVTIFLIQMMKGTISDVRWLGAIPIWVYAVVVSFGLTALAALVLHTLPGDFWSLAQQAVVMAATSTGFYEWWKTKTKPLAEAGTPTLPTVNTARFAKGLLLAAALGTSALTFSACGPKYNVLTNPVGATAFYADQLIQANGDVEHALAKAEALGQLSTAKVRTALKACRKIDAQAPVLAQLLADLDKLPLGDVGRASLVTKIGVAIGIANAAIFDVVKPIDNESLRAAVQDLLATVSAKLIAISAQAH